jgi:integrase/recombinase XerD
MRASQENRLAEEAEWFLDHLLVEKGASQHTVAAYQCDLGQIAELIAKWGIESWSEYDEIVDAKVRAVFAQRKLSPGTVSRKTSSVRSLLRFLIRRGVGPPSGLFNSSTVRRRRLLPKALSHDEVERLLCAADEGGPIGLRNRAMFELLYGGGLRVSELVGLRIEDYLRDESVIRVVGKRGKTRLVPLPAGTRTWLDRYLDEARDRIAKPKAGSVIFANAKGAGLTRSGVFRVLRECANRSGITKAIGPHTLRHTYAVHLVQAGADLRSVQELLGHSSVATTDIYTQLDVQTLRRKYDKSHPRAK